MVECVDEVARRLFEQHENFCTENRAEVREEFKKQHQSIARLHQRLDAINKAVLVTLGTVLLSILSAISWTIFTKVVG